MLPFRSRGSSRLKKAGPVANNANDDNRSSIDNASTVGTVGGRAKETTRSLRLKQRLGFKVSPKNKRSESGSASGSEGVGGRKSGNDNGGSASGELLVKRSEDGRDDNNATIQSAGVDGNTALKHSGDNNSVNRSTLVKHSEDGDNFKDGNHKNKCDLIDDQRQGSGSESDSAAADPHGTGREASIEDKIFAVGPLNLSATSQLMGAAIDFNTPACPPHPPLPQQQGPDFLRERLPSQPFRFPGPVAPVNAQLRRLPPRTQMPTTGPAARAVANNSTYQSSNLRPYSAVSSTSSSATMTPAMYSRRNFPVDGHQTQHLPPPPRRYQQPQQPPQQNAYYQTPQRPGPPRPGGTFPQLYSSSSSARTGESSSPTTQSLESTESPPLPEPSAPSAKSSSEGFVTPSQNPSLEQSRVSPGPYHSPSHGPPNPAHTFLQQRPAPRPLRSAPFFNEGMFFAQLSYQSIPEKATSGPDLSHVRYPRFRIDQLDCMPQHRDMHKIHNIHHKVPCMTCRTMGDCGTIRTLDKDDDPSEWRFLCAWCSIRLCAGCRDELRFQDNRLIALLRVIQEREQRSGLGDPNALTELNIEVRPKPLKMDNTQLPTDLSALTPAASAEKLLNLSSFGPPGLTRSSTPASRPATGGYETAQLAIDSLPRRRSTSVKLPDFEEYDGEPCWPPPRRGLKPPLPEERARDIPEMANPEEYPRQRRAPQQPVEPSGMNPQRRLYQRPGEPPCWNQQRPPPPQPRGPLNLNQHRPHEMELPGPEQEQEGEWDGEPERRVESMHGRRAHQQLAPRQPSPRIEMSPPPQEPMAPPPPQGQETPQLRPGAVEPQEEPVSYDPESRKGSPLMSGPISKVDVPGALGIDDTGAVQPRVLESETNLPEAKQLPVEEPEIKLSEVKQQTTPGLGQSLAQKRQERRTESPLPSPRLQLENMPRMDGAPSPRPEPAEPVKELEGAEESSFSSRDGPKPQRRLPEPQAAEPEPVFKPIEPIPEIGWEQPIQSPANPEKTLPELPKPIGCLIGDYQPAKPVRAQVEPIVYPPKLESRLDLYGFDPQPIKSQESLQVPDYLQLPEIDFGGALDTRMAMANGFMGGPARLGGEEGEGSSSGSTGEKKKWRLPGFGKRRGEKK